MLSFFKYSLVTLNIAGAIACIALASRIVLMPYAAEELYQDEYKLLMFQCDNVMRDHLIAKNRVIHERSDEAIRGLKSAELGLISCHDYDELRKKMLAWGMTGDQLSRIGLQAIEENVSDIMEYVRIHEFKF
jgi:hypothetical protein